MVEDSRTAFQENENPHLRKVAEGVSLMLGRLTAVRAPPFLQLCRILFQTALRAAHTPNELAELEEKKLKDGKDSREQGKQFPKPQRDRCNVNDEIALVH